MWVFSEGVVLVLIMEKMVFPSALKGWTFLRINMYFKCPVLCINVINSGIRVLGGFAADLPSV